MATKIYGTLVGTSVQNLQTSGFGMVSDRYKDGKDQVLVRDSVGLSGNLIGDFISLGILRSTAYIDHGNSFLYYAAMGASCTVSIGDATHPAALGSAISVAAAGQSSIEPAWTPAWMGWPLWQRLGWASDPGGTIELLATFAGANPANQPMAWQIFGRNT